MKNIQTVKRLSQNLHGVSTRFINLKQFSNFSTTTQSTTSSQPGDSTQDVSNSSPPQPGLTQRKFHPSEPNLPIFYDVPPPISEHVAIFRNSTSDDVPRPFSSAGPKVDDATSDTTSNVSSSTQKQDEENGMKLGSSDLLREYQEWRQQTAQGSSPSAGSMGDRYFSLFTSPSGFLNTLSPNVERKLNYPSTTTPKLSDARPFTDPHSNELQFAYTGWIDQSLAYLGGNVPRASQYEVYSSPTKAHAEFSIQPNALYVSLVSVLESRVQLDPRNEALQFLYISTLCETDPVKAGAHFLSVFPSTVSSVRIATLGDWIFFNPLMPHAIRTEVWNQTRKKNPPNGFFSDFGRFTTSLKFRSARSGALFFIGSIAVFALAAYIVSDKIAASVSGSQKPAYSIYDPLQDPSPTLLEDVLGVDEVVSEVRELVEIIKNRDQYNSYGAKVPKGILLSGPPGTGKTMLARAIAAECGVPFIHAPASSFDTPLLGSGKDRIRKLFSTATKLGDCIVFIDEIDTLGFRSDAASLSNMTLNALLVELDGFSSSSRVTVIAATNLPSMIDPALLRPGRLGKHLHVPLPDIHGREKLIKHYLADVVHDTAIDVRQLARGTVGTSGAFIKTMINQAAFETARRGKSIVTGAEIEYAKDKLQMGHPRENFIMPASQAKMTAYHEGGHALLAVSTKGSMPIYKATIMPRGPALGYVQQVPDKEMIHMTNEQMLARMDVALAGRAAEELIYGPEKVTTGASNDYEQATQLAMHMVVNCGFSPLGIVNDQYDKMSDEKKYAVEEAATKLLADSYSRVTSFLRLNEEKLHRLAQALIEHETLEKNQIYDAIEGRPIQKYDMGHSLTKI